MIISREDARSAGLKRFFTGKPCKRGHVAERKVSTNNCCECARLDSRTNSAIAASRASAHQAREAAKVAGLEFYFTGEPCKYGHVADRLVRNKQCCECRRMESKSRDHVAYRAKHREHLIAYSRNYYSANAKQLREYAKQYRQENAETVRAKDKIRSIRPERKEADRKYQRKHLDKARERSRLYRKANPDKVKVWTRIKNANRRAMMLGAGGSRISKSILLRLMKKQRSLCAFCQADISSNYHLDHIMPLKRKGSNKEVNLQLLCAFCNASKGAKTMVEYADFQLEKLKIKLQQLKKLDIGISVTC